MNPKHERRNIIIIMIIAYAFLLIGVIDSKPMHTTTDELGGLVSAAYFAGLDWSGVITNSGYYGFGYYSLFFLLFQITDSPFIIYRTIIIVTALLRVLIIPIAYYILKNYLDVKVGVYLYAVSFLMPFLHTSTIGVISNEYVLEFLIWLSVLLVCKSTSAKNQKESVLYMISLVLVSLYSLFIHTRALTLLIALLLVYFVYGIITKNRASTIVILGLPVFYFVSKIAIGEYQKNVFGLTGGELRNGGVNVNFKFDLFDKNVWDVWFRMIIGMLDTENIITTGIFLMGIVVFFWYLKTVITQKHSILSVQGILILAVSVLCIGATIAAFLVSSWFEGMLNSWNDADASSQYAYKGLTYVRYWNIYVPVFMLCSFSILIKLEYKKIIRQTVLISVFLHILYIHRLIPLLKNNGGCAGFLYGVGHYADTFQVSAQYYFKCIAISLSAMIVTLCIIESKYRKYAMIAPIIFMMQFHYNEQTEYNAQIKNKISSKILASYDIKCKAEEHNIDFGTIYLNDESNGMDANWKIYSVAQFYFNRYTLQMELPSSLGSKDVIISTNKSGRLESMYSDVNCYVLDDNEVWYTKLNLDDFVPYKGE